MKLEELPQPLRDLYQAVQDLGDASVRFHESCEMAEAMLSDTSDLLGPCVSVKYSMIELSRTLPKLARAIGTEAHRLTQKESG